MSQRVVVIGAGPTGLMLAAELALAGVECTVLEKRADQPNLTRAFGVASRTLELLDARGMADGLVARANVVPTAGLNAGVTIDLTRIPSRFNFMLITPQSITERTIERRCAELGVRIERGVELVGLTQDADGVTLSVVDADGPRTERAAYVVGCDGAHSTVRAALGVEFVGRENRTPITLADVRLTDAGTGAVNAAVSPEGVALLVPFGDGYHRAIVWDRRNDHLPMDAPLELTEIRDAFRRIAGTDHGMRDPRWMSRFLSEQRQAARYRVGRVLLAGDAAHTHSPIGAQGMNTGIGDAMNLGWKLAAAVRGTAPSWLLDSYQAERHPVGARVLRLTDGLTRAALVRSRPLLRLVQLGMRAALSVEAIRRHPRGLVSGVSISYPPHGEHTHRLAGHRAPDADLPGGRLYEQLRDGRFLLVTDDPGVADAARGLGDRIAVVTAELPADLPRTVLVRPDAYVAWAVDGPVPAERVRRVLTDWCAPARDRDATTTG
ncbi:FAD-dependent monooxygenase [Pseudonocardia lacus]|uniref:FAD-dependent monooxygenase n=1 Tax=Pseudonocardia lacus TaxID=2835865 RepID=UPI001BDC3580|nr:FAD-dependent monooxygenase [Pseudonocardia lacus]